MRRICIALAVAVTAFAGSVQAAERLVVVELFTSQGCSSCPPADRFLGELAERSQILPLSLHVDYWDYIGWKDEFAMPSNTDRQRAYARAAGQRTIFTPQLVIGGSDHVIGAKHMQIMDHILRHLDAPEVVSVTAVLNDGKLKINVNAHQPSDGPYSVVVVGYTPSETVEIRRGENAGRTITYHNVVSSLESAGTWDGQGQYATTADAPNTEEIAVLVQSGKAGPILAAARAK